MLTHISSVEIKETKKVIQANYEKTVRHCNKLKSAIDSAEESMRASMQKVASDWQVKHYCRSFAGAKG